MRLSHNKRSLPERQNANRDTEHRQRDHPHDDQLPQKRNVLHAFHCSSADWCFSSIPHFCAGNDIVFSFVVSFAVRGDVSACIVHHVNTLDDNVQ